MKSNHKSLKLGVAFALLSTIGITTTELIKQESLNQVSAFEETTTENAQQSKYRKEVQEFAVTMKPAVAKYGITNEKLDEFVNKWVENRKYDGYKEEFNEENKKLFIEFVIDSIAHNTILNSVNKAIDILEKAKYFEEANKNERLKNLKEYKDDMKNIRDYHTHPYSRTRYYEEDRKNLLINYPTILENTIQYIREHLMYPDSAKLYGYEYELIIGYAEMVEEKEINQDNLLSEETKKQLFLQINNILENKYTTLRYEQKPIEIINDIVVEIRKVHSNSNGIELEEAFSVEKVKQYIKQLEKENGEGKINEIISEAKIRFENYVNKQSKELVEEGISKNDIDNLLKKSFDKASNLEKYHYGMNRENSIQGLIKGAQEGFEDGIKSLKAKLKLQELLKTYINSKKTDLGKYGVANEEIRKIVDNIVENLRYYEEFNETFDDVVDRLFKDAKSNFDRAIKPAEIKYLSKERLKEYALEKQQELLKYGISNDKNRDIAGAVFDGLKERHLDYNFDHEDNDAYLESLTNRAKNQYQEMVLEEVIKIKVSKFREGQEKLVLADNRYTDVEKDKVISEIRMHLGEPVIDFLRNQLHNNKKEFETLLLSQKIEKMLSVVNDYIQNTHFTAPMSKNKYKVNNVALNEKLEINQDSSLSLSEKLALQLKVDEVAEKVIKKIETLNLIGVNRVGIPRSMTEEELAVFIEQIQNIHNVKVVNNASEVFKPKEEKIEKPLLVDVPTTKPINNTETLIELKPVNSEKEEKFLEIPLNNVESTKTNEETTKEVVSHNKWEKKGNHWYYVDNDGKAVSKQWIGSYYIKADKTMAENEWIYDAKYNSWFYFDENGHYAENTWKDQYYLKSGGYMAKNEWIFDSSYNSWYYLNEDGSYARNQWIQSNGKWYYVLSNGKMAKNTIIDGYQLNENGEWV